MEWQPIETAPKDGTDILLVFPDETGVSVATIGCYAKGKDFYPDAWHIGGFFVYQLHTMWRPDDPGLLFIPDEPQEVFKPTHWMPLPPPPSGDA